MELLSWNVNGLRAVIRKGFIKWFEKRQPDILCLQETKAQSQQVDFHPDGYESIWNSAVKKGYSGVVIYSKLRPLKIKKDLGIKEFDE